MLAINLALLVGLILFYIFETDGFFEYCKFWQIKIPYGIQYQNILDSGGQSHYLKFLRGIYSESFFVKLLTCPVCLSFYLSAGFSIISWNLFSYPEIHAIGLAFFFGLKILAKFSS